MESDAVKKQIRTVTLVGLTIILTIIAGLFLSLSNIAKTQRMYSIATFKECKAAGYPVMESYPEQCATPDGRTFLDDAQPVQSAPSATGTPYIESSGCVASGCSGQLCISTLDAANGGGVSTCEFRPEFACYKKAKCEPQANGKCGWTDSATLKQCLSHPPALDQAPQAI